MTFKEKYGNWAVITGASSGIGKNLAIELANKGLNLILISRNLDKLKTVEKQISSQYNIKTIVLAIDLALSGNFQKIAKICSDKEVGLIANVAGELYLGDYHLLPIDKELSMIDLNVKSSIWLSRYFGEIFKDKKRGGIIFIGSMLGFSGVPYSNAYSASKAFINSYGEGLSFELKKYGVDVLTVSPGLTKTPMTAAHDFSPLPIKMSLPAKVAKDIISSLGKKTTTTYGFANKLMNWFSRHLMTRGQNVKMYGYLLNKVKK